MVTVGQGIFGVNPHIAKVPWVRLASKIWLLVVAVDKSFYLILDIQNLEHPIGMLVCLSEFILTHSFLDIRFCTH